MASDEETAEGTASEPEAEAVDQSEDEAETPCQALQMDARALLRWRNLAPSSPGCSLLAALKVETPADSASASKDLAARTFARQPSLEASSGSWAAQQRAFRSRSSSGLLTTEDAVPRTVRSILNKLTIEKFEPLSQKLLTCGIATTGHIKVLIMEVFEKATTQHHFISMYTDLCVLLQEHFAESPVSDDPKFSFKRLLLNECQASFERNLSPPTELSSLDGEARIEAEFRYKNRMLGNIKFIGALLARKMLASKVCLAIVQELITEPTPEAIESLAALLTAVGPVLDTPDWVYQPALAAVFEQARQLILRPGCDARSRCLLKDVLELRASGWKSFRAMQAQAKTPTTLREVSRTFSECM
jgi:hypothetical protein